MSRLTAIQEAMFSQTERPFNTAEVIMPSMPSGQKIKTFNDIFSFQQYHGDGYQWIIANNDEQARAGAEGGGCYLYYLEEDTAEIAVSSFIPRVFNFYASASSTVWTLFDSTSFKIGELFSKPDPDNDRRDIAMFKFARITRTGMSVQHGEVDIQTPLKNATEGEFYTQNTSVEAVMIDGFLDGFTLLANISGFSAPGEPLEIFFKVQISYSGNITSLTRVNVPGEGIVRTLDLSHLIRVRKSVDTGGVYSPVHAWIIDASTLAIKAQKTFTDISGYAASGGIHPEIPRNVTTERRTQLEKDLYGRRIIAAVRATTNATSRPERTVVWLEDAGSTSITEVELTVPYVDSIIGTDRAGNIYYHCWPSGAGIMEATISKQRVDGSLAWTVTRQEWEDAGWSSESFSVFAYYRQRTQVRTTANDEISIRDDKSMMAAPYMSIVIGKDTGIPISSSKATYNMPTIGGNLLFGVTTFDQYNATTNVVDQRQIMLNMYSSTINNIPDRSADKFRVGTYAKKYRAAIKVIYGNTGESAGGRARVTATVDGDTAWPMWDYNDKVYYIDVPRPGVSITVVATDRGYKKATKTFTFDPGASPPVLTLMQLDWQNILTYDIYTPQDLFDVREDPLGHYRIMNDIDMSGFPWEPMFVDSGNPFMGSVEGQEFTIRNFNYIEGESASTTTSYGSIFGKCQNAQFRDIKLENCTVQSQSGSGVAVLAASNEYTEIYYEDPPSGYEKRFPVFENITAKNCGVSSLYGASYHGIICGEFLLNYPIESVEEPFVDCRVVNCSVQGLEWGGSYYSFGGIVGYLSVNAPAPQIVLFKRSTATLNFSPHNNANSPDENIAPLVGHLYLSGGGEAIVDSCGGVLISSGQIRSVGLIGRLEITNESSRLTIQDVYSEMDYTSATAQGAGGIIGLIAGYYTTPPVTITRGWAAIKGTTPTSDIGNTVGMNNAATLTITDFYADARYTDLTVRPGVTYLPTDKIYKRDGYPALDFETLWTIEEGIDYPRFMFNSSEVLDYLLWLFHTPTPTPVDEEHRITEFRAGKVMNYRIYDVSDGMENARDITSAATIEFLPIPDSEVPVEGQVEYDTTIKYLQVNDATEEFTAKVTYQEKYTNNKFEVFGPDYFELSENLLVPLKKNVPAKAKITAYYRDDTKEVLTPVDDFVVAIDDKFIIGEQTIKPLEVGEHKIEVTRFRTKEQFELEVEPLEIPGLVDVINTAATLYVFFRLDSKMEVDTYFAVRAFKDAEKTEEIVSLNTIDNTENFTITVDGAGSWQPIPQAALSPSGEDSEMYCAKVYVGPTDKVYLDLGITTGEEMNDIYAPLISATPPPGTYNMPVAVSFTLDEPGDIFYTYTEGIPNIPYQQGETILLTKTNTLRVIATDKEGNTSKIASYKYVIDVEAPIVHATPPPGPYLDPVNIELYSNEENVTIYYTTDGTEPTHESDIYTTSIRHEEGTLVVKAIGVDSAGNTSEVTSFEYEIVEPPKGDSFDNPIIHTAEIGEVQTNYLFNTIDDVYVRYDNFIPGAMYEAQFVDVPQEQGNNSGCVIFKDDRSMLTSNWIMVPTVFEATSESLFIMAARGTSHWDPVKLVIRKQ